MPKIQVAKKLWFSLFVVLVLFVSVIFTQLASLNSRDTRTQAASAPTTVTWTDPIRFRDTVCLHGTSVCQPFHTTTSTSDTWTVADNVSYDLHVDVSKDGSTWYGWEQNNNLSKDCPGSTCSRTFSWAQVDFVVRTTIDNIDHAVRRPTTSYTYSSAPPNFSYTGSVVFHYLDNLSPQGITIKNLSGNTGPCTVSCPVPPPSVDIKANNSDSSITIPYNSSVTIKWTSSGSPTSCSVSPTGWTGTSGQQSQTLTSARTYKATCSNSGGSDSDSVTVNVSAPGAPSVNIKANGSDGPIKITKGKTVTISWTSGANTTSCTIAPFGWTGLSGSKSSGALSKSTTFKASCTGPGGSGSDSVVVNVETASTSPTSGSSVPIIKSTTPKTTSISKDALAGSKTKVTSKTALDIVLSSGTNRFLIGAKEVRVSITATKVSKKLVINHDNEYFRISASELKVGKIYTLEISGDWLVSQTQRFKVNAKGTNLKLEPLIIGDLTGEGRINDDDIFEFLNGFLSDKFYDFNVDGVVNSFDYSILIGNSEGT
ncbi:MAG: hypothetical protein Q8P13_02045 [bacterium]|nr:hypothetical protein [bacterium]